MYVADDTFFELQKDILYQWHQADPVNDSEINRTWHIADYQDYPNPFILDDTLKNNILFGLNEKKNNYS